MARDFVGVDRGQLLLMPPSLCEWLPEDHLVWTVLGAVERMDLDGFNAAYRLGAAGRAPFDPAMMVALLLYSYARGNRSSRGIERACWEDVAFKVITGMRTPDHSTIAEFRRRHEIEIEIADLFDDILGLCREAGLVSVGVITIDGTKIKANASMDRNRDYRQIATEILREAEETDRREDELYGEARGDELPEQLRTPEGRQAALEDAKRRIAERKGRTVGEVPEDGEVALDPQVSVTGKGGRKEWLREGRRELERHREQQQRPIPRDRADRLFEAARRLEQSHQVEVATNALYEQWRAGAVDRRGRRLHGIGLKPWSPPESPAETINVSDPDSRVMRTQGTPPRQAYNTQAAVNDRQVVLAAEVTNDAPDFAHLGPMLDTTQEQLARVGGDRPARCRARRRWLLAHRADAGDRRAWDRGVGPSGRQPARRDPPRLGERSLSGDARDPGDRPWSRALQAAQGHDRAGVRADQIQPSDRSVHAKRQSRCQVRVAVSHSDAQPAQAAHPLDHRTGLTAGPAVSRTATAEHPAADRIHALTAFSDSLATKQHCRRGEHRVRLRLFDRL
jgi:transposase